MDKALMLLQIQKQAFEVESVKALGFHMVNITKRLIDYKQAVFWRMAPHISLENVSGNAMLDGNGPHGQWLKAVIKATLKSLRQEEEFHIIRAADLPQDLREKWPNYAASSACLLLFRYGDEKDVIGGLWIEREKAFHDQEVHILQELLFYYTRALILVAADKRRAVLPLANRLGRFSKYAWIVLVCLALCPVKLSVSAPAEVVATSARTISAPFDGLLADIKVSPGERVVKGQIIAEMDVESLRLRAETAAQAFSALQTQISQLRREVLRTPEKKTDLNRLSAELKTKEIDRDYARAQLEKAEIRAVRDGIALFADVNDLEGKPVSTGQVLMQLADPEHTELLIRLPVQAQIPFDESAPLSFFPNASPLSTYTANISAIGYQASADADGLLTYKVRGDLQDTHDLRVGAKGLAKIEGGWTILIYRILRRPLITLRDMAGI